MLLLRFAPVTERWITKLDANMKTSRLKKPIVQMLLVFNLLAVSPTPIALGDIANVDIEPFSFNPPIVTINVNDQVVWTWVSDFHDTVSDTPGLWNSGVFNTGHVFTNTFASQVHSLIPAPFMALREPLTSREVARLPSPSAHRPTAPPLPHPPLFPSSPPLRIRTAA